jgi:predicted RNA-binding protein with PIN domain
MAGVPDDVAAGVVRGMGAFIRAVPAAELPPKLKRFKRFDRPQALAAQKDALLAVLDSDELTRARIGEWMAAGKLPLTKREKEILRLVATRPDGWEHSLAALSDADPGGTSAPPRPAKDYAGLLAKEKERTAKVKDELRRERDAIADALTVEKARSAELDKELDAARKEVAAVRSEAAEVERLAASALRDAERTERKSRSAIERASEKEKALKDELRSLRRELRRAQETQAKAKAGETEARPTRARSRAAAPARRTGQRPRLRVPKGRLETDPETLDEWLAAPDVHLLVDGYNVTKAEGGFGGVDLALQRRRLIEGVGKLARKKKARATIVFDGSDVPPGTSRRPRGPAGVEYSSPGEIADDHLIALLEGLDARPVVVATNDRELQHRAAALGATVATSNQLLALIR